MPRDSSNMHRIGNAMMQKMILSLYCLLFCIGSLHARDTNQFQQLTVEQAQELAQNKSGRLLLDGLNTLSPEVATELAKHEGWLSLGGLTTISDEAAATLAKKLDEWVRRHKIKNYYPVGRHGVCHSIFLEGGHIGPGMTAIAVSDRMRTPPWVCG